MIANSTKGTLVGVAVAAVIALLHALGPVGCTSQLACWFPDEAPYRFLSAFLFALPLAILFGGGLGIAADDLWGGLVQRLCVLANEGRLFQVFLNLIVNAAHASTGRISSKSVTTLAR